MAIPILNHLNVKGNINLNDYKLNDFVVDHSTQANAGTVEGKLIYDSGTLKFYDGSSWQSLGTSTGDITRVNITAGDGLSGDVDTTSGDHTQTIDVEAAQTVITSIYNTSLKLGRSSSTEYIDFATDNVIKLVANSGELRWNGSALLPGTDGVRDLGTTSKEWKDLFIDGTANIDSLVLNGGSTVTVINDEDDMSSDSATALATQQSIKAYVDGKTYDDVSIANLKTALAGGFASNAVQIGDSNDVVTIGNDLTVTGDLIVSGDTITANVGTLDVEDKNITINKGSGDTSSTADGAGITIQDAVDASNDASLTWNASNDKFVFSHLIDAPGTSIFANLDISGDVDVDGTLEADAITINGTATGALALLNTVDTAQIDADAITGAKIADDAINSEHITDGSVDNVHLAGSIANAKLANSSITIDGSSVSLGGSITTNNTQLSFASAAEVQAGTNTSKAINPDKLAAKSVHATIDVSDSTFASNLYAEITHSLGSEDVIVQLFDSSTKETVIAEVARTDKSNSASTSKIKISFSAAPSNDIEVLITSIEGSTAGTVAYS